MTPSKPQIPSDQLFPRWERFLRLGWVSAAVAVVALGYYAIRRSRPEVYVPDVQFSPVTQWTSDPGLSINPVFSPDGKLVAYSSDRGGSGNLAIWIRPYPSGEPRRLTNDEFDQSDPDFSPTGSEVVYHSNRDGGGIYLAPVSGSGQPRLVAKGGKRPRFSPGGEWIAYYTDSGDVSNSIPAFGPGRIYVISPLGGDPKPVHGEFPYAQYPLWSPDGSRLLFQGVDGGGSSDWWVTPVEGGDAVRTHAFERLAARVGQHLAPERWIGDKILFPAAPQQNLHLWELTITPGSWQAAGFPRQLTGGDWIEQAGSVGADGRLLFTRMHVVVDIWSLPIAGSGTVAGKLQRLTDDRGFDQAPTVARHGDRMLYLSDRSGMRDLWVTDLKTGSDTAITAFKNVGYRPVFSPDGSRVAFRIADRGSCAVYLAELSGNRAGTTVPGCFNIWDWNPDGSGLLIYDASQAPVSGELVRISTGERTTLISSPRLSLFDAEFSPDGRWVAFTAGTSLDDSQVYVAPYRSAPAREGEWIPVSQGDGSLSAWSPAGDILYFHSKRDGFHCIWAQRLDAGKRPAGASYAIQHFHTVSFGMYMIKPQDFRMSVTSTALTLNLATENANLWVTRGKVE